MSERKLRSFETGVLGPQHAREHAELRAQMRHGGPVAPRILPRKAFPAVAPSVGGRWEKAFPLPVLGITSVVLPTGKVMLWAYPSNELVNPDPDAPNTAQAWLWNPAKGTGLNAFKRVNPPLWRDPHDGKLKPANIWCAGQTLTGDGRVVVAGGNLAYATETNNFKGLKEVYTFDPWNETWKQQPDMPHGRWYPSLVRIADGRVVIMSGLDETGQHSNPGVDMFTPSADLDGRGTVAQIAYRGGTETDHSEPLDGGLYPHLFYMPSGRVMVAGPETWDTWMLHYPVPAPAETGFDEFSDLSRGRTWGSGVIVPEGPNGSTKVELIGGSAADYSTDPTTFSPASNTTETFDESGPALSPWHAGASMQVARSHLNTVLLPDGSMVSVGGGVGKSPVGGQWAVAGDERQVDLYDPVSDTWRLGAAQAEARAYHSTAVLLPDGRVMSAGDDYNGPTGPGSGIDSDTAEIYDPPYLFNADGTPASRPRITSAPPRMVLGGSAFHVSSPDHLASAALVAPGADTHANDMNQRMVPLKLSASSGGVDLTPPSGTGVAPPGYYMLFVLNSQGVPSVARWVLLGGNPPAAGKVEIAQHTIPAFPSRFTFSGPPFDGLSLADGGLASASLPGGPSTTVPGGHYTITQAKAAGYELSSIACSDGDSTTSLSGRSARINLAAGETVRCTFTDRASGSASQLRSTDSHGPAISFSGLNRRHGSLSGRVRDKSGVKRMQVGLALRRSGRCRWWSSRRHRFARSRRSCRRPVFMKARLRRSGSGYVWRLKLHRRFHRARYVVALRAVDKRGNVTTRFR